MAEPNADPQDDQTTNQVVGATGEVEEVEIDTQPIIEEVVAKVTEDFDKKLPKADKIADDVRDGIIEKLTGGKDKEDQSPWQKEGRSPKSYDEVAEWGTEKAKKELRQEIEEKDKVQAKKDNDAKAVETKRQEDWNKYWDGQIEKLVSEEKIPAPSEEIQAKLTDNKPLTEEEKEDPGIKARADIFRLATENKENNLELVYYKHFSKETKPAGASAPVIGSRKAVTPSGEQSEYTYEEVHNAKTMHDLLLKG